LEFREDFADHSQQCPRRLEGNVSRKLRNPNFDQTLETLRAHSFDVSPYVGVEGGVLVSKGGVGAVLVSRKVAEIKDPLPLFAVAPGILAGGQVERLLDRGFQKYILGAQGELPAQARQLHAIHNFTEELKLLAGMADLYNEGLGTTNNLHQYDRLTGRGEESSAELAAGH
jgi:hypothetical protein